MRQSVQVRPSRRAVRLWSGAVLLLAVVAIFASRQYVLKSVGRAMVVDEPLAPADIIVLADWAGRGGALEAADLIRSGIAPRVAVLPAPPDPADLELQRRGIDWHERASILSLLHLLGVTNAEEIPIVANGTEEQGRVLAEWCDRRGLRTVIVVSSPDHSRRLHRTLRRAMSGHSARVLVRTARYAAFDPAAWWKTHTGIRTAFGELPKLLVDLIRHPLS